MAFNRPELMIPKKKYEYEFETSSLTLCENAMEELKPVPYCHNYHKAGTQSCRLTECEVQQSEALIYS